MSHFRALTTDCVVSLSGGTDKQVAKMPILWKKISPVLD